MSHKTHDLCIAVGQYKTKTGDTKTQYRKIGSLMEGDNGPFVLLNAEVLSMPLFALANRDRRDAVILSLFAAEPARQGGNPAPDAADDIPW